MSEVNGRTFLGEMWRVINGGVDRKRCDLATRRRGDGTREKQTHSGKGASVGKINFRFCFVAIRCQPKITLERIYKTSLKHLHFRVATYIINWFSHFCSYPEGSILSRIIWKPWHYGSTVFQNAPCSGSETMAL